eukprot:s52_g52.t1
MLLEMTSIENTLHVTCWDGLQHEFRDHIQDFAEMARQKLVLRTLIIPFNAEFSQMSLTTCGTVALLHLGHSIGYWKHHDLPAEDQWHLQLLNENAGMLYAFGPEEMDENLVIKRLREILHEHGRMAKRHRAVQDQQALTQSLWGCWQGTFVTDDDRAVMQISIDQVAADKFGLAFGSLEDVAPYLKEDKSITLDVARSSEGKDKENVMPWSGLDPWGGYNKFNDSTDADQQMARSSKFEQLQSQVQDVVRSNLKDATEQRFLRLETGITELREQNQKFETWFGEAGQSTAALHQDVSHLTSQVREQQQNMTSMALDIQKGFANIEALLSKKQRQE